MIERMPGFAILLTAAVVSMVTPVVAEEAGTSGGEWWNIPYPQPFDAASLEHDSGCHPSRRESIRR